MPTPTRPADTKLLQIRSTPASAHIAINGRDLHDLTPATINLPADTPAFVTVKVSLAGYQSMEREVEVITGAAVFELQKNRGTRRIIRRRRPSGRGR